MHAGSAALDDANEFKLVGARATRSTYAHPTLPGAAGVQGQWRGVFSREQHYSYEAGEHHVREKGVGQTWMMPTLGYDSEQFQLKPQDQLPPEFKTKTRVDSNRVYRGGSMRKVMYSGYYQSLNADEPAADPDGGHLLYDQ